MNADDLRKVFQLALGSSALLDQFLIENKAERRRFVTKARHFIAAFPESGGQRAKSKFFGNRSAVAGASQLTNAVGDGI
ncbi:hypothetical protein D3C85_1258720 [compost metagenome]